MRDWPGCSYWEVGLRIFDSLTLENFNQEKVNAEDPNDAWDEFRASFQGSLHSKASSFRDWAAPMDELSGEVLGPMPRELSAFRECIPFADYLYDLAGSNIEAQVRHAPLLEYRVPETMPRNFVFHLCLLADALEGTYDERIAKLREYFENKSCLEIGPGGGFELNLLSYLGGKVQGIDIDDYLHDPRVVIGNILDEKSLTNLGKRFNFIYSINVFTTTILRNVDALIALSNLRSVITPDCISMHQIHMEPHSRAQFLYQGTFTAIHKAKYSACQRNLDKESTIEFVNKCVSESHQAMRQIVGHPNKDFELNRAMSNVPSVSPADAAICGYTLISEFLHDRAYTMILGS